MRNEFRILAPGEIITAGDQLMCQGGWHRVPDRFVGNTVEPKHAGSFRRVSCYPSDEDDEK